MLKDGFYKVAFSAALPGAGGVVVLDKGVIRGGDDQMIYSGSYRQSDPASAEKIAITATLSVRPYTKNAQSVFGPGVEFFTLDLAGTATAGTFNLAGPAPNRGPAIVIQGNFVAPLQF
ncbi:GrlR family regulatory protein [Bordetella genomosp. 1]|nr:GrlR family regulatory protein [Bordetella genomosp. 1]